MLTFQLRNNELRFHMMMKKSNDENAGADENSSAPLSQAK